MNRTKLQRILNRLDGTSTKTEEAIRSFDDAVKQLQSKLREEISASTLDEVNSKISKLRKSIDFEPLLAAVNSLETTFKDNVLQIYKDIEAKSAELKTYVQSRDNQQAQDAFLKLNSLQAILDSYIQTNTDKISLLSQQVLDLTNGSKGLISQAQLDTAVAKIMVDILRSQNEADEKLKELDKKVDKGRIELVSMIASKGGGSMNRNISIGGNPSVLSKYTDINLKAGSNVTITYSSNDATKNTDITISSNGGGGSVVGGTVRSINTISTSQTLGSVAGTDYVYICSAGIKVTMPPDVATNTNLYTVKNTSTSSVLVIPNGAETIDGQNNIIMPIQYTSIDLISDTSNWNLT